MSEYVVCEATYTDPDGIRESLIELGVQESKIEIHEEAVAIVGYHGRSEGQKANIVIRKGGCLNGYDIGFRLKDGVYIPQVVDMDICSGIGKAIHGKEFKQIYAKNMALKGIARKHGCKVYSTEKVGNKIRIKVRVS